MNRQAINQLQLAKIGEKSNENLTPEDKLVELFEEHKLEDHLTMPPSVSRIPDQLEDELDRCNKSSLLGHNKPNNTRTVGQCSLTLNRCQQFIRMAARKLRYNRDHIAFNSSRSLGNANGILIAMALSILLAIPTSTDCLSSALPGSLAALEAHQAAYLQQQQQHHHSHHHSAPSSVQLAQARVGGLEPGDYVDEAGELEVLANQQQIPTAQLMAAAGHIVPDNFFLPGGSIPALYAPRYQQQAQHQHNQHQLHQQQQQQQIQQQHLHHNHHHQSVDQMQQASSVQARHVAPNKFVRQADLIAAAEQADQSPLIDFNGYNLVAAAQQEAREGAAGPQMDLVDYINSPASQSAALYEQQQQHYAEQQVAAELAALASANQQHHQLHHHHQQHQNNLDQVAQSSNNENLPAESVDNYAASIGPAYQISGLQSQEQYGNQYDNREQQKPYGLPTKSSSREPSGMLKPLGNPKTISSPLIDFVANQASKTNNFDKLAEKIPQMQTPTVFSFASSKDPSEKVKQVNQKKRGVMRQAEQIAKMMIKSVNEKFGTTIGDQSDIPFLLSALGPLGMAQNILFDPTLLVTLLNSAEKTYFSDVLPSPAKSAIRPVLNIFRVPNKKRDKANLLNIISFIASGGQTPSSTQPKHRQGTGVEKMSKNKNKK